MPPSQAHATPSSALSSVAERLRAIRRELDLTLSDVALRSGVSISNLSKIERADVSPSFDVVIRICEGSRRPIEHFVRPGPQSSVNGRKTTTLQLAERPPIEGFMNPATRQGNATASSCCQAGIAAWTSPPPHNSARACDRDVVIP
jgi:transcriptional regulator with XRE-family HTH domain